MAAFFTYKGVDSSGYLIVNSMPSLFKAEKSIEKIEVPGRDGFMTIDNHSYKGILSSVTCTILDLSDIDYICSWLTGSGDLVLSHDLSRKYKATIVNKIEFSRLMREVHTFVIQFDCQPHRYEVSNTPIELTQAGAITNPGSDSSQPVIKIYGTGDINLTINGTTIQLSDVVEYIIIDSELMDCYKDFALMNNSMLGEFPKLIPGSNSISWTGTVAKIEIVPNWRWI